MRIALDLRPVNQHFPGIGRFAFNLAQGMVSQLEPAEMLILLRDPRQPSPWKLEPLVNPQVQLVDVPVSPFSLRQQWVVPRLLSELKVDLYHSFYYLMPYYLKVPALLTAYDLIPLIYPDYFKWSQRLIFRVTMRLATRVSQHTLAISETTAHDLERYLQLPSPRFRVILGAADPIFAPLPIEAITALRSRLGLPEAYVLYVGSNKPHKNLVRLVEAWAMVQPKSLPLVIAGVWDPRYPEAKQRVAALGLDSTVHFLGPVADEDLPGLYGGAELFVFPSEYEGFGLPVLEAMACGTPVICTNSSSVAEVAEEAALTFDPKNIEEIAQKLDYALTSPAIRSELRERGLVRASQFSWKRAAQETLGLYRSL